jgi:hypothetical protein
LLTRELLPGERGRQQKQRRKVALQAKLADIDGGHDERGTRPRVRDVEGDRDVDTIRGRLLRV